MGGGLSMKKRIVQLICVIWVMLFAPAVMPQMFMHSDVGSTQAFAQTVEHYGIWLLNQEITSENLSGESWSFDPETYTLTLNGWERESNGKI